MVYECPQGVSANRMTASRRAHQNSIRCVDQTAGNGMACAAPRIIYAKGSSVVESIGKRVELRYPSDDQRTKVNGGATFKPIGIISHGTNKKGQNDKRAQ